jgi:hypothetical protein
MILMNYHHLVGRDSDHWFELRRWLSGSDDLAQQDLYKGEMSLNCLPVPLLPNTE